MALAAIAERRLARVYRHPNVYGSGSPSRRNHHPTEVGQGIPQALRKRADYTNTNEGFQDFVVLHVIGAVLDRLRVVFV